MKQMTPEEVEAQRQRIETGMKAKGKDSSTTPWNRKETPAELRSYKLPTVGGVLKEMMPFFEAMQVKASRAREVWEALPDEEKQRRLQALEAAREEKEQEEFDHWLKSFVPPLYRGAELEHRKVLEWVMRLMDGRRKSLLFASQTGTGKTYNMWGIAKHLASAGFYSFSFHQVPMLMTELRPRPDNSEYDDLHKLITTRLLFLDDIGAHKHSEWVEEKLFEILDSRYQYERPVVLSTNVHPGRLSEVLGDRLASRLAEMCDVVVLEGPDRRRA